MHAGECLRVRGLGVVAGVERERQAGVVRGGPARRGGERVGESGGDREFGGLAEGVRGPRGDRRDQEQCEGAEAASRITNRQMMAAGSRGRVAVRYAVGRLGRSLPESKEGSGNVRCGR